MPSLIHNLDLNGPGDMRLADLLFCEHEGPEEQLQRRRIIIWEKFLKLVTLELCPVRKLSDAERRFYTYWFVQI